MISILQIAIGVNREIHNGSSPQRHGDTEKSKLKGKTGAHGGGGGHGEDPRDVQKFGALVVQRKTKSKAKAEFTEVAEATEGGSRVLALPGPGSADTVLQFLREEEARQTESYEEEIAGEDFGAFGGNREVGAGLFEAAHGIGDQTVEGDE